MRNLRQFIRPHVSYCTTQFSSVQIFEEICVRSVQQILVLLLFFWTLAGCMVKSLCVKNTKCNTFPVPVHAKNRERITKLMKSIWERKKIFSDWNFYTDIRFALQIVRLNFVNDTPVRFRDTFPIKKKFN